MLESDKAHHVYRRPDSPPSSMSPSGSSSSQGSNAGVNNHTGSVTGNAPHTCSVCGADAGEHLHYGAVCCFSCRAFFRRYADRQGQCACARGDGMCVINVERRNDCMHCRLKKCLRIGMKKDFVRGPNQSLRRKRLEHGFKGRKSAKTNSNNNKRSNQTDSSKFLSTKPPSTLRNSTVIPPWNGRPSKSDHHHSRPGTRGNVNEYLMALLDQEKEDERKTRPYLLQQLESDAYRANHQLARNACSGKMNGSSYPLVPTVGFKMSPPSSNNYQNYHPSSSSSSAYKMSPPNYPSPPPPPINNSYQTSPPTFKQSPPNTSSDATDQDMKPEFFNFELSYYPENFNPSFPPADIEDRSRWHTPENNGWMTEPSNVGFLPRGSGSSRVVSSSNSSSSFEQFDEQMNPSTEPVTEPPSKTSSPQNNALISYGTFSSSILSSRPSSASSLPMTWGMAAIVEDSGEEAANEDIEQAQDEDSEDNRCKLIMSFVGKSLNEPTMSFTSEEFNFLNFIRLSRNAIVGRINNAYYDEQYREELTTVLMSYGRIKPSFQFIERLNKSIMHTSMDVMAEILSIFNLSDQAKKVLMSENVCYACLVGTAVYTHGNDGKTFVEQAKQSGMTTLYVSYLEENGLAEVVPRMESHYLNPSPWAEKEAYEVEFNDILKQIGKHVGSDQFLTCLLIMAHLFSLSAESTQLLTREEAAAVAQTRRQTVILLNRYLRVKYGPKKAASKTHHHFYLMNMLKRVSKIYMEKKLNLVQADNFSDIRL